VLIFLAPFTSSWQRLSGGDCLDGKWENYQTCFICFCFCWQLVAEDILFWGFPRIHPCAVTWTQYLTNRLQEFQQIYSWGAVGDKGELIRFWSQKVKGQGHDAAEDGQKLFVQKCTYPSTVISGLPLKTISLLYCIPQQCAFNDICSFYSLARWCRFRLMCGFSFLCYCVPVESVAWEDSSLNKPSSGK